MGKFNKLLNKIIKQQKLTSYKKCLIMQGFLDSLKEVGNIVGGAGETLVGLGKGDLKAAGKGLWKTVSAPIGAITELGSPSYDQLKKQYEESKEADFNNDVLKKCLASVNETYKDDKKVIDEFTDWSEAGKELVSKLEGKDDKEKAEKLRKILAIRKFKKDAQEQVKKLKAPKKEDPDQKDTHAEDEAAEEEQNFNKEELVQKFRQPFLNAFGQNLTKKKFDTYVDKQILCIAKSNGKGLLKLSMKKAMDNPDKYEKIAIENSKKAKEARNGGKKEEASKDEDKKEKGTNGPLSQKKVEQLKKKVKPVKSKNASGKIIGGVLMKNEGESDQDYKERFEILKKAKPDLQSVLDPQNAKKAEAVAQLAAAMGN